MPQHIPEPEGWVAKAIISCLRQWHEAWGDRPMPMGKEDIDCLERWADQLLKSWIQTEACLQRNNIPIVIDPVKIKPEVDTPTGTEAHAEQQLLLQDHQTGEG